MSELLYVPSINPPPDVLNHAILYRTGIATIAPPGFDPLLSDHVRAARDAGLYTPMPGVELFLDWFKSSPIDAFSAGNLSTLGGTASEMSAWQDACSKTGFPFQQVIRVQSARFAVESRNKSPERPLLIPCCDQLSGPSFMIDEIAPQDSHLLAQVDVGRLLPNPDPAIDPASLIAFRERYDDERQRLLNAVERLVEEYRRTYENPADIERSVRRDVTESLDDMQKAGRGVLKGWSRRIICVIAAAGATATTTVAAGAPTVVTVGASVASGLAINVATNPVAAGWRDDQHKNHHYLYRIHRELDENVP